MGSLLSFAEFQKAPFLLSCNICKITVMCFGIIITRLAATLQRTPILSIQIILPSLASRTEPPHTNMKGNTKMSNLLINEPPLQIIPSLAVMIGLSEAIALQQLHYWLAHSKTRYEGKQWIFKTIQQWQDQDFKFWTEKTIRNVFKSLIKQELVLVEKLSENKQRRVNYYTINYKQLDIISKKYAQSLIPYHPVNFTECNWQFLPNPFGNFYLIHSVTFTVSIRQILPNVKESKEENTKENTKDIFKSENLKIDEFKPSDKQTAKMIEYGIDDNEQSMILESFICNLKTTGKKTLCLDSSFTVWLNTHIMQNKLKPVTQYQSAFPDWNDRNPDYQPANQGYNPSHQQPVSQQDETLVFCGVKRPPFAGMTKEESMIYIDRHIQTGESSVKAYDRLANYLIGVE